MSEGRPTNPRLTGLRNFSSLVLMEKGKKGENNLGQSWRITGDQITIGLGLKLFFQIYFILSSSSSPCSDHSQASGKPIQENAGDRILPGLGAVGTEGSRWGGKFVSTSENKLLVAGSK